jgi:hypothetical protein
MAIGDAATAAGMDIVPPNALVKDGNVEITQSRDYIADYAKRTGPLIDIWVQPTAPAHAVGRVWIKTT